MSDEENDSPDEVPDELADALQDFMEISKFEKRTAFRKNGIVHVDGLRIEKVSMRVPEDKAETLPSKPQQVEDAEAIDESNEAIEKPEKPQQQEKQKGIPSNEPR